jgi:hypothetical protein
MREGGLRVWWKIGKKNERQITFLLPLFFIANPPSKKTGGPADVDNGNGVEVP